MLKAAFYHSVGSENQIQAISLGTRCFYLQSPLTSPSACADSTQVVDPRDISPATRFGSSKNFQWSDPSSASSDILFCDSGSVEQELEVVTVRHEASPLAGTVCSLLSHHLWLETVRLAFSQFNQQL